MKIQDTEWGHPGPAAPPSLDQRPGDAHPDFARVRAGHLNVPGPPISCARACWPAGLMGPWTRSGVRLCWPLIGPVMYEFAQSAPLAPWRCQSTGPSALRSAPWGPRH
jgi:hypothetical protein